MAEQSKKDRSYDEVMAELFSNDPAYAAELKRQIEKDGDPAELAIVLRQLAMTGTKEEENPFLQDDPASLPELLDVMVWDMSHTTENRALWRSQLLALPHADNEYVQGAIAVIDEFNAPEGSPEAKAAHARAWPDDA